MGDGGWAMSMLGMLIIVVVSGGVAQSAKIAGDIGGERFAAHVFKIMGGFVTMRTIGAVFVMGGMVPETPVAAREAFGLVGGAALIGPTTLLPPRCASARAACRKCGKDDFSPLPH